MEEHITPDMEEYITPERIANAIMQDRSFNGCFLVVEGIKDFKLFNKFMNPETVQIKEAFGCGNVVRVIEILIEREFFKGIGIIDSDFSTILNTRCNISRVFVTDDHDIEVMIIKTRALDDVLHLFAHRNKINGFIKAKGQDIRSLIFSLGKEIGYLKLADRIYQLKLMFKPKKPDGNQLKYKNFISEKDLSFLGQEQLIDTVINYSRNQSPEIKDKLTIKEKLREISKNNYDLYQLVNGHDISHILFILLKNVLKSTNKMLFDFNSVEDSLILAYESKDFQTTNLFKMLYKWAEDNNVTLFNDKVFN